MDQEPAISLPPLGKLLIIEWDMLTDRLVIIQNDFSTFEALGVLSGATHIIARELAFESE